eukprot:CAMPEP_0181297468 /NCGR_PEP_ID=MMETSP1101-20121128/5253_1 /TAXON_ID=46948 /ORGANISM="Rhodomonas abbreviata, Strain Caron Lab Isolate" /LENGTH=427 /DNA_ID=CAMNT_0023402401 /DNA_START=305 /DNA_END=1588 /DNA_ORIENTATION=+
MVFLVGIWLAFMSHSGEGKVIAANIKTFLRQYSDIYLGMFTFNSAGGKIAVHTLSEVHGQRFLFFDGRIESWPHVLAHYQELSCVGLRNISLMVTEDEHDNSLSEGLAVPLGQYQADLQLSATPKPAQWYTMLSNCNDVIDIDFKLTFLNPGGWWKRQFSVDEQGLLALFMGCSVLYTAGIAVYGYMHFLLHRSSTMHPLLWVLWAAILLQYVSLLLQATHGFQYAGDGEGLKALQGLGEVCDASSNVMIMVLLLLMAKGMAVTTAGAQALIAPAKQWLAGIGLFMSGFFSLFTLERVGRALDTRYCYDTDVGVMTLVLRTCVFIYFLITLNRTIRLEETEKRRTFLKYFGIGASAWFMALPLAYCISQFLEFWDQMKFVITIGILIHTAGLFLLGGLMWPQMGNEYVTVAPADTDMMTSNTPYDEI